jgi:hypothetical protein
LEPGADQGGWTTQRLDDGTLRWTSPHARSYDNPPAGYPTTTTTQTAGTDSDGVVPNDNNEADPPAAPPLGA